MTRPIVTPQSSGNHHSSHFLHLPPSPSSCARLSVSFVHMRFRDTVEGSLSLSLSICMSWPYALSGYNSGPSISLCLCVCVGVICFQDTTQVPFWFSLSLSLSLAVCVGSIRFQDAIQSLSLFVPLSLSLSSFPSLSLVFSFSLSFSLTLILSLSLSLSQKCFELSRTSMYVVCYNVTCSVN